jgi:hypothetical protein
MTQYSEMALQKTSDAQKYNKLRGISGMIYMYGRERQ